MSYILEALKKAQAERQLGETPTIHAPTLDSGVQRPGSASRIPLAAAVGVMGAVIAGLIGVLWYQASQTEPVAAPAVLTPAAPPAAPVAVAAAPVSAPVPVIKPAPVAKAPVKQPEPVAVVPTPAAKPPEKPQEEPVQALRDLPEPIQRAIPPVSMSGYMYSSNPADRMILIDKVLRREGDEVAPGVVLARLEPKAAVFTFRGYRYRVPY